MGIKCSKYSTCGDEIFDIWKPGKIVWCTFGGVPCKVTIRAVGKVITKSSTSYHVQYLVPVGNTFVKVNWLVKERVNQLFETEQEAIDYIKEANKYAKED